MVPDNGLELDSIDSEHTAPITPSSSASDESAPTQAKQLGSSPAPSAPRGISAFIVRLWIVRVLLEWWRYKPKRGEDDGRFGHVKYQQVEEYENGYPRVAALLNSDPNFRIYRRFGNLRNRVILYRQHELVKLETQLNKLDEDDSRDHKYRIQSIERDSKDPDSTRQQLINSIDHKLKQYDQLLERERKSMAMHQPTERNYRSLVNYFWNRKPIVRSELESLNPRDDLIVLTDEQDSPIHQMLSSMVAKMSWIKDYFTSEEQKKKTSDRHIKLLDRHMIEILARSLAIFVAVALIAIPVCILFLPPCSDSAKVGVVIGFCFLFPIAVSTTARPKNMDLFTATAAYCAVLVAFLANATGRYPPSAPNNTR